MFWNLFKFKILISGVVAFSLQAMAKEVTVFDVRSTFRMSKDQPAQKDYYLNGGSEVGLVPGVVVDVSRLHTLYDAYQNKSPGNLLVTVGRLEIIHAQSGLSVARLQGLASETERPILEDEFIMVGDKVDLSTARKKSGKKEVAVTLPLAAPLPESGLALPAVLPEKAEMSSQAPVSSGVLQ